MSQSKTRPIESGRRDSLGRKIMVSGDAAAGRSDAPIPPSSDGDTAAGFDTDALVSRGLPDDGWTFPDARPVSTHTPWGTAQYGYKYAAGINSYSCAGHGGFKLSPTRNAEVHEALRNDNGFYEEDCEWAAVAVTFPEAFPQNHVRKAVRSLRDWNPDGWTAATGEPVELEQSSVLRKRAFNERHANDQVAVSAIGGWKAQYGFDAAGNTAINDALDQFIDEHRHSEEPFDVDRVASRIVDVGLASGVRHSHVQNAYPHDCVRRALLAESVNDGDDRECRIDPNPTLPVIRRTPEDMVKVTTMTGGQHRHGTRRAFLVHQNEYRARGEHSFVVDPTRHQEIADL